MAYTISGTYITYSLRDQTDYRKQLKRVKQTFHAQQQPTSQHVVEQAVRARFCIRLYLAIGQVAYHCMQAYVAFYVLELLFQMSLIGAN
jgi:hypothetical protein